MIKQNPFLSDSFKSIWLKHFNTKEGSSKVFKFISDLEFVAHNKWPIYVNLGETHTKGISYTIDSLGNSDLKNQTLLIYDIPTYFEIETTQLKSKIKLLKSKQYPGFLIETGNFKSLNDYMLANFSKNSRNKNNKYKRRLEASFNITYKMFFGEISKAEYDFVFAEFKRLLEKRFADKQITNNNLDPKEWAFYFEVAYDLILEKKASLYVIYDNDKPIGVTLSYFSEDVLFDAITVFDIDYFKFHLGSVTIMKLIEWCIENNIKTLDFSKGYFDYKTRWCTKTYDFEYHIYYDSTSLKSRVIAFSIKNLYDFKHKLREKNINEKLHKLTYKLKKKEVKVIDKVSYSFVKTDMADSDANLLSIDYKTCEDKAIKLMIFEFLYLYQESYNNIRVFSLKNKEDNFLIKGEKDTMLVVKS